MAVAVLAVYGADRLFLPGVSMACNWPCGFCQILSSIGSFLFHISVVELVVTWRIGIHALVTDGTGLAQTRLDRIDLTGRFCSGQISTGPTRLAKVSHWYPL